MLHQLVALLAHTLGELGYPGIIALMFLESSFMIVCGVNLIRLGYERIDSAQDIGNSQADNSGKEIIDTVVPGLYLNF